MFNKNNIWHELDLVTPIIIVFYIKHWYNYTLKRKHTF
jgi:hypothetical protein